ncbi:hypothetical protein [Phocaeicola sp.]|jgi:hypothetical protein
MGNEDFTLSRHDLIKIAALTLLLPLPVNWVLVKLNPMTLMAGADDVPTWIGFGGSYIGGIIGGVISILILNRTLQQTAILHHDLKILQLNTIIYTQEQEWFSDLKTRLAENLKAIDLYVLNTVVSCMSLKNYAYAKELLTDINKQLEYQVVMSSFYFMSSSLSKEEEEYMDITRRIHLEYSSLIKDLLFYIPLAESSHEGHKLEYEDLIDYTMSQYDYLKEQNTSQYEMKRNITSQILEIGPEEDIEHRLQKIMEIRLTMRINLYKQKSELAHATHQLIDYEEKRINKILTNN